MKHYRYTFPGGSLYIQARACTFTPSWCPGVKIPSPRHEAAAGLKAVRKLRHSITRQPIAN